MQDTVPTALMKVLRGAGRVAGDVIADEAGERSISDQVSAAIKVKVTVTGGRVAVWIHVKGKGSYLAIWLEYGTAKHEITVRKARSLVIGGKFVGTSVQHPGVDPHPFLRPALDLKIREAIAAAQAFIDARVRRSGIDTTDIPEGGA